MWVTILIEDNFSKYSQVKSKPTVLPAASFLVSYENNGRDIYCGGGKDNTPAHFSFSEICKNIALRAGNRQQGTGNRENKFPLT